MKKTRLIAVIFAALMALSAFGFTAYAEQEQQEQPVVTEPGGGDAPVPVVTEEPYVPVDPVVTDPPYVPIETEAPYVPDYPDPVTPEHDDDGNNNNNNNNNNSNYYDGDGNAVSNPQEIYVGGGQSYVPPKSIAPSAALYDTDSKKIDDKELSKNDWGDIAANLKNAGKNGDNAGGGDFSFIQNNTAKEDNGHWMLFAGAACLALSLAGFIYLIASAVSRRKKFRTETSGADPQNFSSDDYGDGYKTDSNPKSNGGRRYK